MAKLTFSFLFLSTFFSINLLASPQNALKISQWDLKAINASHTVNAKNKSKKKKQCSPSLKNITQLKQQANETLFSSDNCFAYSTSKDGWVTKTDTQTAKTLAKIRVGLMVANTALSKDDKILLIGNRKPADLILLNTQDLSIARIIPVKNRKGILSPVAKVGTANDEQGFIVAPQKFSKIWKINYQNPAPIGFGDGWNHDYRCMKEHVNKSLFPIKRLKTKKFLEDFYLDDDGIFLVGKDKKGNGIIMDLDLSRIISRPKIPKIGSGLIWKIRQTNYLAILDDTQNSTINIYSNKNKSTRWKKIKSIIVKSAISISSCPTSSALWVATKDAKVHLISKENLQTTKIILSENNTIISKVSCLPNNKGVLLIDQKKNATIYDNKTFKKIAYRF